MNYRIRLLCFLLLLPCFAGAQMSGNYTIDPSGIGANNYISFSDAVDAMSNSGISGNVVFTAASGTYHETVVIQSIVGMGPSATITFQSATGNPLDCIIETIDPSSSGTGAVILRGAKYVNFKGISMHNFMSGILFMNTSAVHIRSSAEHLSFNNCRFVVDTTSGSPVGIAGNPRFAILIANDFTFAGTPSSIPGQFISFKNSLFKGGATGIAATGMSYDVPADSISVDSCEFIQQISSLMDLKYCRYANITHSTLHEMRTSPATATVLNGNGVRLYFSWDFNVRANTVKSIRMPLLIEQGATTGSAVFGTSMVVNNYFRSTSGNTGSFIFCRNTKFIHNTFKTYGADVPGVIFSYDATNIDFINNLVQAGWETFAYAFTAPATFTGDLDFNVYYGADGKFNIGGTVYNTLADWITAYPAFNNQSVSTDSIAFDPDSPVYGSFSDYYPGISTGMNIDIYGESRCNPPAIGAYEFKAALAANDFNPDTVNLTTTAGGEKDTAWISVKNYHPVQAIDVPQVTLTGSSQFTMLPIPLGLMFPGDSILIGIVFGPVSQCESEVFTGSLAINASGCPYSIDDTITLIGSFNKPPVVASISVPDTTICDGDTISLTGQGGSSYVWYPAAGLSGTTSATVEASPDQNGSYFLVAFDEDNCSDTASIAITLTDCPTSVPGVGSDKEIAIYPVPVTEMLYISNLPEGSVITVYDITGRRLIESAYHKGIDVKDLKPGNYLLYVAHGEKYNMLKFIKE